MARTDRIDRVTPVTASFVIAGLGVLAYAVFSFVLGHENSGVIGHHLYDQYFLSILDGHLDVPARAIGPEGHFTSDGTAYVYHGLAPLLTRFVLGWFVPLGQISLASFSIWFWSLVGTGCYHFAFFDTARRYWPEGGHNPLFWSLVLAFAAWFYSPGLFLSASPSLFNEPIAVGYALSAIFVLLWQRHVFARVGLRQLAIGLALTAALALHARPNLALGLYFGAIFAAGLAIRRGGKSAIPAALAALFILGLSGAGFLALNAARFGSPWQTHGTYDASPIQYGFIFWGIESVTSERASAFIEHGTFNPGRILPNALLYLGDIPAQLEVLTDIPRRVLGLYRAVVESAFGYVGVEEPRVGMLYIWMCWFAAAFAAVFAPVALRRQAWGLWLATGLSTLITLSFAHVTFRGRIDVWPLLAAFALIGLSALVPCLAKSSLRAWRTLAVIMTLVAALPVLILTIYEAYILHAASKSASVWTRDECIVLVREKGLPDARIPYICRDPYEK